MADNKSSLDNSPEYSEETIREFTEAMKVDLQVRLMERENDRVHLNNSKEIALASISSQAEYLKRRPVEQRWTMIVAGLLVVSVIIVLGWFYVNEGQNFVLKILGGLFYLGSVYFSYKFGLQKGNSNQIQEFD